MAFFFSGYSFGTDLELPQLNRREKASIHGYIYLAAEIYLLSYLL
jgi:hypothetical protein